VRDVIIRTLGELRALKSVSECFAPDNVEIHTRIINATNAAVNGVTVTDTLPAGFTVDGSPVVEPSGSLAGAFSTVTLGDGRTVYNYTVNTPANGNVRITYHGSFATLPTDDRYTTAARITPPSKFTETNTDDNYATITGLFGQLSAATYTNIPLTGVPVTLGVAATNSAQVASYTWEQSAAGGANWTPLTATTDTYTHTGTASVSVRCAAQWDFGCRDTVVFRCIEAPDNVSAAECFTDIKEIEWTIKEAFASDPAKQKMTAYATPLVGDQNSDGIPEVIVYNYLTGVDPRLVDSIYVF
jgi:hypothetical protein